MHVGGDGWQPRELLISSEQRNPDEVIVAVRDTGVGIDSAIAATIDLATAERIFDSFYTTNEGGLGLGLSISRTIIEAHGGKLWAASNDGQGATFQFTIPISDPSA